MGQALAKADSTQFAFGQVKSIPAPCKLQRHGDIFERRHIGNQMEGLEHNADIRSPEGGSLILAHLADRLARNLHDAVIDMFQTGQNHEERGLAGTGRANDTHRLAGCDMKGNALQHMDRGGSVTERQVNVFQFDNRANKLFRHAIFFLYGLQDGTVAMTALSPRHKNELVLRRLSVKVWRAFARNPSDMGLQ
ncbi:hypothetical protein C963_01491 [Brucella melitensis CNGB 1120]|nr:hypothetical protein C963_01491 [Brucella melitensis CNGB 1120]